MQTIEIPRKVVVVSLFDGTETIDYVKADGEGTVKVTVDVADVFEAMVNGYEGYTMEHRDVRLTFTGTVDLQELEILNRMEKFVL